MKWQFITALVLVPSFFAACENTPVQPVAVPGPNETSAYPPMVQPKPLPPEGYIPGEQQPQAAAPAGPTGPVPLANEDAFVVAYTKRKPKIMVFVNRTLTGDPVSSDTLNQIIHSDPKAPGGATADNIGTTSQDYDMIEAALVSYFDHSGRINIQDSEAARAKLTREQLLRVENGDPSANRLLANELQADVLIRVAAKPTIQSSSGPAIRLIAKAVSTTDARNLGTYYVDMPLPMTKTYINMYTRKIAEELMGQMATKWGQAPEWDPIEVRIYKSASIDDSLKISDWLRKTGGVTSVKTDRATGGSATSYAVVTVGFSGAPDQLYASLKDAIGASQGLKAVDLQNNTIDLEVTGPMNLVTTTRHVETTTETRTIEDRRIEPINPAPAPSQP